MTTNGPQPLPFAGIRVIEIAEIWAGPVCGVLLGDLGADIVKVEAIQRSARGAVRPLPGSPGYPKGDPGDDPWNRSSAFNAVNRNKRGVTLDLHSARGQALLDRLLADGDVVFTNLSVDAQESLNLLPERLLRANPQLVVVLMTGFGMTGPYRYYRSMGMTLDAASGHSVLRGYPDLDLSTITPVHHPDAIGAAMGLFMIALPLERRAQTGEGQVIDMAQLEAAIPHVGDYLLDYQLSGELPLRLGNAHPSMAVHGCFATSAHDEWVAIAADTPERVRALCEVIARPDLGETGDREALASAVAAWACTLDRFHAEQVLQSVGVPAAAVLRPDLDQILDAQLWARGAIREADFHGHGRYPYPAGPWHFADTEPIPFEPAPRLGEHNHEILAELLGLSDAEIAELAAEQVIGTEPLEGADAPVAVRRH